MKQRELDLFDLLPSLQLTAVSSLSLAHPLSSFSFFLSLPSHHAEYPIRPADSHLADFKIHLGPETLVYTSALWVPLAPAAASSTEPTNPSFDPHPQAGPGPRAFKYDDIYVTMFKKPEHDPHASQTVQLSGDQDDNLFPSQLSLPLQ